MNKKIDLRIKAKNIRKILEIKEISEKLVVLIRENSIYINAKNVMIFYPKKYELDFRELLNDEKNFYLPRVNGEELDVCPYELGDKLKLSSFKVFEPVSNSVNPCDMDLIIVPALLVDKCGHRLGYGGGYYDRLLQRVKKSKVQTLCAMPQELVVDKLPNEDFDISVDEVVLL